MKIFKHELKLSRASLLIWTAAITFLLVICVMIFPDMKSQANDMSAAFAQMGSFSQAFGMDKLNFGEFSGFFGIECGNILGLGGALFAALAGISALAKEESDHTAEFLLTHPISRAQVIAEKLLSIFVQIVILNAVVIAFTFLSVYIIGESPDWKPIMLMFLAYFIMQIEVAAICFGISAFLKRKGLGIGLGSAIMFYFINIIANMTEDAKFLKYITPFGYTDGADIIADGCLKTEYILVGTVFAAIGIIIAFVKYCKKDIA